MRWLGVILILFPLLSSCAEYPITGTDGRVWIVPDDYKVDPNLYPKYRAIRDFQPPDLMTNPNNERHLKMPPIKTDYVWEVRHRVGDKLWVFSEKYHEEKCLLVRCYGPYVFEISLFPDGRVEPGWKNIKSPKSVLMRGDRAIPLTDPHNLDWGSEPLFKPIIQ